MSFCKFATQEAQNCSEVAIDAQYTEYKLQTTKYLMFSKVLETFMHQ